jgi:hypothetical protein
MMNGYNNSIGGWIQGIFGKTKSQKEVDTLNALAQQPVTISPLVFIVPALAIGVFGIIYFTVINKKS